MAGSWIRSSLALRQALLSSICRSTHVVRIDTKPITDASTTIVQTSARRPRPIDLGTATGIAVAVAVMSDAPGSGAPALPCRSRRPAKLGASDPSAPLARGDGLGGRQGL